MISLMSQTDPVRQWRESVSRALAAVPRNIRLGESIKLHIPGYQRPPFPDPWSSGDPAMPLVPIWPAFAVNTLFYATILWLLIPGPFTLRRFLRVRRGLCPKCAYPMGESPVCTECGRLLPKRVAT